MLMLNLQICMLNEKLSDAERMTCDVLRDLLGVKIDMTNVAVQIHEAHSWWISFSQTLWFLVDFYVHSNPQKLSLWPHFISPVV